MRAARSSQTSSPALERAIARCRQEPVVAAATGRQHHPARLVGALLEHHPARSARASSRSRLAGPQLAREQPRVDAVADGEGGAQPVDLGRALHDPRRPQRRPGLAEPVAVEPLERLQLLDGHPDPVLVAALRADRLAARPARASTSVTAAGMSPGAP